MKAKSFAPKIAVILLSAVALVGLYQNCSSTFNPLDRSVQVSESLDAPTDEPLPPLPGPAPKIIEAKILGDVPFPVFLEESGAISTRDPLISWRFRHVMGDARFKKLGNVLTTGNPSVFCAILESGQPRCMGKLLGVDLAQLPTLPESAVDIVGNPHSIFALSASGSLYFLQMQGGLRWVRVLPGRIISKIISFSSRDILPNSSGQFVALTILEKPGNVGFIVHSNSNAARAGATTLTSDQLSYAPSLFPSGATDIAPSSTQVAALYGGNTIKYCPDRTSALAQGEVSPCWDVTLPSQTSRLWSENPSGSAGCVLSSEKHPYCFGAHRYLNSLTGELMVQMSYFSTGMGAWASNSGDVLSEPVESIHFATETANFLVIVTPTKDAKVFVQQSARLGADLFARLGYTKTQYENITLTFKPIQFGKDVGLIDGRICGPDPTGTRFLCVMPLNWWIDFGMPNSAKFMTSFVGSNIVAQIYGAKAPLPRSGKFVLGNNDVVYALNVDPGPRMMPVISAPGAKYLRCSGNTCQIDFEDGTSRVDEYLEVPLDSAGTLHDSNLKPSPLAGSKLPVLSEASSAQLGGLALDERLNVETGMCGVSAGQLVCLERVPGQASMRLMALPPTSNVVDHRSYFSKPCIITSEMRLSCLKPTVNGFEIRNVAMREPAARFFGTPVYQGVSGRFYGLREISPGQFGDYELKSLPAASEISNVILPRTDMSAWQALSSDGEQSVVIEKKDGSCQYRGMDTNDLIGGPFDVDVRYFQ